MSGYRDAVAVDVDTKFFRESNWHRPLKRRKDLVESGIQVPQAQAAYVRGAVNRSTHCPPVYTSRTAN